MEIRIAPPFWRTWWAYLIYFLLLTAAVWYLLRNYKHKLQLENRLAMEQRESQQKQKLNEERMRFFTNIAHELRTPLNAIVGFTGVLEALDDGDDRSEYVRIIRNSSDMLLRPII